MIKLLENGTLTVLRTYGTFEEAILDLRCKMGSGKYLIEYANNRYGVETFLNKYNN